MYKTAALQYIVEASDTSYIHNKFSAAADFLRKYALKMLLAASVHAAGMSLLLYVALVTSKEDLRYASLGGVIGLIISAWKDSSKRMESYLRELKEKRSKNADIAEKRFTEINEVMDKIKANVARHQTNA